MKESHTKKIETILKDINFISFDHESNCFILGEECNTKKGHKNVSALIKKLRWNMEFNFDIKKTPMKNMNFSYHDSCMQNYCFQIIDEGVKHKHTCWENITSRRFHLGIWDEKKSFDNENKERYINQLSINTNNEIVNNLNFSIIRDFKKNSSELMDNLLLSKNNWISVQLLNPISFQNPSQRHMHNFKSFIKKLTGYKINERVIDISKNILLKNWNHELGWECPNTVLGYSTKSKEYMTFTGRHRVNAAIYLFNKGVDIGIDHFSYPVIKYNWDNWLHDIKPLPHQIKDVKYFCDSCKRLK